MDIETLVKDELSGSTAKSFVSLVSGYHRIQASAMFHEAALHVVDELRRIGVRDVEILQFPADGRKRFWTHEATLGWRVKSAELRLMEPKEKQLVTFADTPMSLHTFSQGTPKGGVTAELVDVGAGIFAKDYKGKRVKDKVVLATGNARSVHAEAVVKRGAAGVLTDTLTHEFPRVRETIDVPDAHSYQGIWPTSKNAKKIRFGFSLSKRQGQELRGYLARGKKVRLKTRVDARLFPGRYDIVTAAIKGSSKAEEEVFLIAHLCHPKPGANDNSSGSGLLMEIARTLTALISSGKMKRPARTIRFFWVPETTGTVALLSNHPDRWRRLVAGLNLDMVGEDQETCKSTLGIYVTPDSLPSYLGDLVLSVMERSSKELDPMTKIGLASTFRYARFPFSPGSDHAEFVDSTVRVPCVSFTQWPDKFYHTSMDTIDRVSEESLRRVGWVAVVSVLKLANANTSTALELSALVCSRGSTRLAEAAGKASEELYRKKDTVKPQDAAQELAKLALHHRNRLMHVTEREKEAVRSVMALGGGEELEGYVQAQVEALADAGKSALARLEETMAVITKDMRLELPRAPRQTKAEKESKRVVPRRRFKGTLGWTVLSDFLGEEGLKAYKKIEEADPDFTPKMYEIINFMDGKRTAHYIAAALSAEYGPTDHGHVMKFLRDLEQMKLVSI